MQELFDFVVSLFIDLTDVMLDLNSLNAIQEIVVIIEINDIKYWSL
jgi:hypothetical protein